MRYKETGYTKYMTDEEFELIKDYVRHKIYSPATRMCLYVMMYLGLRVGEAVQLRRDNFNHDFSNLVYELSKQRKGIIKHERDVPEFLQDLLKKYDRRHSIDYKEGFLFFPWGNDSETMHISRGCINNQFMKMRRALGLMDVYHHRKYACGKTVPLYRISPHTLRHYCCWKYYKASDKDLVLTSKIIGHKKISTTAHYIYSLQSRRREKAIVTRAFGGIGRRF